jgi:leucine efflux protein
MFPNGCPVLLPHTSSTDGRPSMFAIETIASFVLASSLVILVPGPATFFVMGQAGRGMGAAAGGIAGIVVGDIVLISCAGLGFAALVAQWPFLINAIKVLGSAYVAYIGIGLIRQALSSRDSMDKRQVVPPRHQFAKGIALTLSNPKPLIFFAGFFPAFLPLGHQPTLLGFYALGAIFQMVNVCYFAALTLLVRLFSRSLSRAVFQGATLNLLSGIALLICSGILLATLL